METKDKMKGRLLLDIVVRESAAIMDLFAGKDKILLVGRDTISHLNLIDSIKSRWIIINSPFLF
jgi:hypothetical protein